jgi:hypothetical protein
MSCEVAASTSKGCCRARRECAQGGRAEPFFFLVGPIITAGGASRARMFGLLMKLAEMRGADLDGKRGGKVMKGQAAGDERAFISTGLGDSDTHAGHCRR